MRSPCVFVGFRALLVSEQAKGGATKKFGTRCPNPAQCGEKMFELFDHSAAFWHKFHRNI
jgi:hypothetical protein